MKRFESKAKAKIKPEETSPEETSPEASDDLEYKSTGTKDEIANEIVIESDEIGSVEKPKPVEPTNKTKAIGMFQKVFYDKYHRPKYYIKVSGREQIESTDPATKLPIMIYEDDKTECSYYDNLNQIPN